MNSKTALKSVSEYLTNARTVRRLISIGLLIIMAVVFSISTADFMGSRNISIMLRNAGYIGLITLGMSFVIIGGGIDLSAGGIVSLASTLCVRFSNTGAPGIVVALVGVAIGAACGLVNAFFVTRVKLTEFVATLATGFAFSGLTIMVSFRYRGMLVTAPITNQSYKAFRGDIGGLFYITIVWVILTAIMYLVLTRTKFGVHTYAIGSHRKSAQMSGVNNDMVKMMGYVICGMCAGLAAVMQTAIVGSSQPNIGTGYEFQAIAACVVGGVVLGGGRGDAISALIGSLFLVMLMNGLFKYGLSTSWEYILQGAIIIVATSFDAIFNKITTRRLLARTQ